MTELPNEQPALPGLAGIRRKRGLSQSKLAERVGVSTVSISNYESGRNSPTLATLIKIARALDVGVDALLTKD